MSFVDLTMPLNPRTPVYPGDPSVELTRTADFEQYGYIDTHLSAGVHNGTHIDAPRHMLEGGASLDTFPIERFFGQGVLLDARRGLERRDVEQHAIESGDIVLLWTGLSDHFEQPEYYEKVPVIAPEAVASLASSGASLIAIDAGSIDAEPFPVHKAILGAGILLAENLVNMSALEGLDFRVCALPINLDVEAAPARIVAILGT